MIEERDIWGPGFALREAVYRYLWQSRRVSVNRNSGVVTRPSDNSV